MHQHPHPPFLLVVDLGTVIWVEVGLALELVREGIRPGSGFAEVIEEVAADGGIAGLGRGRVRADSAVRDAERVSAEEVEDFGVGENGGLGIEYLYCVSKRVCCS